MAGNEKMPGAPARMGYAAAWCLLHSPKFLAGPEAEPESLALGVVPFRPQIEKLIDLGDAVCSRFCTEKTAFTRDPTVKWALSL